MSTRFTAQVPYPLSFIGIGDIFLQQFHDVLLLFKPDAHAAIACITEAEFQEILPLQSNIRPNSVVSSLHPCHRQV